MWFITAIQFHFNIWKFSVWALTEKHMVISIGTENADKKNPTSIHDKTLNKTRGIEGIKYI